MKIVLSVLGVCAVLLALVLYLGTGVLGAQATYILIFALIGVGGWALLKFIQNHY